MSSAPPTGDDRGAHDEDPAVARWFLSPSERGNPHATIDRLPAEGSWSTGCHVVPLLHGATYFRRLHEELCTLRAGDRVFFTDWCGDADQRLLPGGAEIGPVLCDLLHAGVEVRGLLWRSHPDRLQFNEQENQRLGRQLNDAGGQILLDQRVRTFASHHQKLFVVQHAGEPERDLGFVGGIDLCHGRRDDVLHEGDPQQPPMDRRYRGRAPWHDAALELRGPVVGDLLRTFAERWDDSRPLDRRTPYRMLVQRRAHMPRHTEPLPEAFPDPPRAGRHAVQLLRTYGHKRPGYPFAPHGERSVGHGYRKAFSLARRLVYLEDQYLWSELVVGKLREALRRSPELLVIAVVPRYPDADGRVSGPPNRIGRLEAMRLLTDAAPDRVAVYDLENLSGVPIYVHAKVCVVDDLWFTCGSDNFNRRSWTSDSELSAAVIDPERDVREPRDLPAHGDGARRLPRDLRLRVWAEHLGVAPDHPDLVDPGRGFALWRERAAALDAWHASGRRGPRPPGHARVHRPEPVSRLQALWARPLQRLVFDPDGRPRHLRGTDRL